MVRRFQIEDLIVQDVTGVVFHAVDSETGRAVALRRFFPFGPDGGGLSPEEQRGYKNTLGKLEGFSHPALRELVCGGCDPIDGMPFIATGWIDGETLDSILARAKPAAEQVIGIIMQALEVSELLSIALAEEAVWVDTMTHSIVFADAGNGSRFIFWISPLRRLGTGAGSRGLESIASLAENLGAWNDWNHDDPAVRGLGGWIQWLRVNAATISLPEVRQALAAFISMESSALAGKPALRVATPVRSSPRRVLLRVGIPLFLAGAGLAGWWWTHRHAKEPKQQSAVTAVVVDPLPAVPSPAPMPTVSENPPTAPTAVATTVSETAARPTTPPRSADDVAKAADVTSTPATTQQTQAPLQKTPLIPWNDHEKLIQNNNNNVIVEGILQSVSINGRPRSICLFFSKPPGQNDIRGLIKFTGPASDLAKTGLQELIGKKIRIAGKIVVVTTKGIERPDIMLPNREAVKQVP